MYIRGLIPRNFAELAEAVPIDVLTDRQHEIHPQATAEWANYQTTFHDCILEVKEK